MQLPRLRTGAAWRLLAEEKGCCEALASSQQAQGDHTCLRMARRAHRDRLGSVRGPVYRRLLYVLLAALCRPVACPDGPGAGGRDNKEHQQLAADEAVILTSDGQHALAMRVPPSLLDPSITGTWYLPCSAKGLPQPVVEELQSLDEYRVPAGVKKVAAGSFSQKWCHFEWHLQLGLEREPIRDTEKFTALHHEDFHVLPRTQRLPAVFHAATVRFRAIPEADFPTRGYPLMGPAGSGHGRCAYHLLPILCAVYRPLPTARPLLPAAQCVVCGPPMQCTPTLDASSLDASMPRPSMPRCLDASMP